MAFSDHSISLEATGGGDGRGDALFFISNTYEAYHLPGILGWHPHAHMHSFRWAALVLGTAIVQAAVPVT